MYQNGLCSEIVAFGENGDQVGTPVPGASKPQPTLNVNTLAEGYDLS